jgi:hypothetical protein
MGLGFRSAATLWGAALTATLSFAVPAYSACPPATLVSIPATTTVSGVNDTFVGLAFSIDGAIDGDGLFFQNAATGDPLTVLSHATVDSTTGAAGNEGIFIQGDFGDICYDGDAAAAITSASDGLSVDQFGDGDVLLNIAHTINALGSAVLVTHEGNGDVDVHTTASMQSDDAGIVVDQEGLAGDINIVTKAGTTITAVGGGGLPAFLLGPSGIVAFHDAPVLAGSGNITINNGANIVADDTGIFADLSGWVDGTVAVRSSGNITAFQGITALGDHDVHVDVTGGTISADQGVVVFADTGDVTLAKGATLDVINSICGCSVGIGLVANAAHATVAGAINAPSGTALQIYAGESATVTLEPGYIINGFVNVSASTTTLEFGGDTGDGSFDLDNIGTSFIDQYGASTRSRKPAPRYGRSPAAALPARWKSRAVPPSSTRRSRLSR